jgi:hypothetical protein
VFTDSPQPMLAAEADHRRHAVVEQVIAALKGAPLAHLPSGKFAANSAWLVLAAIAFNLTRAAGALASSFHAKATIATIRTQLIAVPARLARSARRLRLHLPRDWPWCTAWTQLFDATCGPPPQRPPDHPAAPGARNDPKWKSRTDRQPAHARINRSRFPHGSIGPPRSTVDRGSGVPGPSSR